MLRSAFLLALLPALLPSLRAGSVRTPAENSLAAIVQAAPVRAGQTSETVDISSASEHPAFQSLALSWSGSASCNSIRVRVSEDSQKWSEWRDLLLDSDLSDAGEKLYFTGITHFSRPQRFLQYSFDVEAACSDAAIEVTVTMFPPSAGRVRSQSVRSETFTLGNVQVRSRTDWGCPDGQGSRWTPAFSTVTHAFVHHTAGFNNVIDWEAEVRSIWAFHTLTRGWGDVGYNFLIDPNGVIYEGRAGGQGAIGAHFSCRNTNTVGVAMLGTFTSQLPTGAAMKSLQDLMAELTSSNGIAPAVVTLHKPSGLMLNGLSAHRDGNTPAGATCTVTECPGNFLYAKLPELRSALSACKAVSIDAQPSSLVLAQGSPAQLRVMVSGSGTFSYQWFRGTSGDTSTPVAGGSSATLAVISSTSESYWVRVNNECGSVDSATAVITTVASGRKRGQRRN